MDPISIYFFAIASIIGIETTGIVSRKETVTINPVAQTFEIHQEDLFSIMATREDSLAVANEFRQIAEFQQEIAERYVDGWIVEEIIFSKKRRATECSFKRSVYRGDCTCTGRYLY